ncbi:MAG: putative quinol monooxygenase [Pseudomonadota bacterium]
MFAVVVTLRIAREEMSAFLPAIRLNASKSLANEPGCHRFDVCTDPERQSEVFLYELYENEAAFQAHLATDHFKHFDAQTAEMVLEKDVRTFAEVTS